MVVVAAEFYNLGALRSCADKAFLEGAMAACELSIQIVPSDTPSDVFRAAFAA